MTPLQWIAAYEAQAAAIFAAAAVDPGRHVPSCPGWSLQDLAAHVGAAPALWEPVLEASPEAPPADIMPPEIPDDIAEMVVWCIEQLELMAELFRSTDPEAPVWTGAAPGRARFWIRRAALETAVHLWDACSAVGDPRPVPAALAADGFDELVELFPTLMEWSGHTPRVGLVLEPDDADGSWRYTSREPQDVVAVSGSCSDLYLAMWGRGTVRAEGAVAEAVGDWARLVLVMAA